MKRSLRRALWAGAVVAVTVAAVPMTTAFGAGSVTATFAKAQDWGTGHETKVTVTNGSSATVDHLAHRVRPAVGHHHQQLLGRRRHPQRQPLRRGQEELGRRRSPRAPRFSWGYNGTGAVPGAAELHRQRRAVRRRHPDHPADHDRAADHRRRPRRPRRPPPPPPTTPPPTTTPPNPGGKKVVGYFAEWGVYGRNYHVKNIHTSGSAAKLTHILYAFGNTTGGRCTIGDSYADYDKAYTAADSVDGVADTWDQPLRGSFNQLRKLKQMYPHLKVIWSFGGWTWSGGFTQAAQNPAAFADSCYNLVKDPRWADVFDGIDIDWEYPNACGLSCDSQRPERVQERDRRAADQVRLQRPGHRGDHRRRQQRRQDRRHRLRRRGGNLNWLMPMTYDYFGAFAAAGPDRPALAAHLVHRHPAAGLLLRRGDPEAQEQGRPGQQAAARHRLLRPGLDRGDPDRAGRHRHRRGTGHLRGGHRGLQGAQEHLPGHRHGRRHRVRQVRQQLVELRHPGAPSAAR